MINDQGIRNPSLDVAPALLSSILGCVGRHGLTIQQALSSPDLVLARNNPRDTHGLVVPILDRVYAAASHQEVGNVISNEMCQQKWWTAKNVLSRCRSWNSSACERLRHVRMASTSNQVDPLVIFKSDDSGHSYSNHQ